MTATELLQDALDEEDASLVEEAIRQGADVNALWEEQTMLSAAIQIGDLELVRLLLSAGADPNRKNDDGTTALTWCGNAALTEVLLDNGASAIHEKAGRKLFTSLHNAATDGDVWRIRLLLERGEAAYLLNTFTADLGWTPLHEAADEGHLEAAQLLIDAGADPNLFDHLSGDTAIRLAALKDDLAMVQLLLANGADPTLTGSNSALAVAREHPDKPEILECIETAVRRRWIESGRSSA